MKQEDFKNDIPEIFKFGCYFLSLCNIAEKYLKKFLRKQEIIEIYLKCKEMRFVTDNCYILSPEGVLNFIFNFYNSKRKTLLTKSVHTFQEVAKYNPTDLIQKVETKFRTTHFIVVDPQDFQKSLYDPSRQDLKPYRHLAFRCFRIV